MAAKRKNSEAINYASVTRYARRVADESPRAIAAKLRKAANRLDVIDQKALSVSSAYGDRPKLEKLLDQADRIAKPLMRAAEKQDGKNALAPQKKNPRGMHLAKATAKEQRQYEHVLASEKKSGKSVKASKRIAAATVRKAQARRSNPPQKKKWPGLKPGDQVQDIFGNWNEVFSVKGNIVDTLRGGHVHRTKIIKVVKGAKKNPYVDLVIYGQATKTPQGWRIGRKTIPQGSGVVSLTKRGYYLDKSTGLVYAKRVRSNPSIRKAAGKIVSGVGKLVAKVGRKVEGVIAGEKSNPRKRNAEHRDAQHPIHVSQYWQGRKGYKTPWQRAHEAGQGQLFKVKNPRSRRRNESGAESRREQFAGKVTGHKDLYFPEGTPQGLSTLGPIVSITTAKGRIEPTRGRAYLCQAANGHLYLGADTNVPLWDGPAESFGSVKRVEYECAKPHLGEPRTVIWYHDFEDPLPELKADGKGGLRFHGGGYAIKREGIVG